MTVDKNLDKQLFAAALQQRLFAKKPELRVGRYEVHARIAEGGGGRVYRGFDPDLARVVAIKMPLAAPATAIRLRQEAQTLAKFHHRALVQVYDVVDSPWGLAVILAWVDGGTLTQWQAQPGRTVRDVIQAYVEAGRGLAAVHACGLVHRDFKPDNVLMTKAGPQLCDFGLARSPTQDPGLTGLPLESGELGRITEAGAAPGTPAFMSPEQRAGAATAKGDQYSWCLSLREALVLQPPEADPDRLCERIDDAITRGLSPESQRRHRSLERLLDEVEEVLAQHRSGGRRGRIVASIGGGGLVVALGLGLAWQTPLLQPVDLLRPTLATPSRADAAALEEASAQALSDYDRALGRELEFSRAAESLEAAYGLANSAQAFDSMALLATRLTATHRVLQDIPAALRWADAARYALRRGELEHEAVAAGVWNALAAIALDRRQPEVALELSGRSLSILEALDAETQQDEAIRYAVALYLSSLALLAQNKHEDALVELVRARKILEIAGMQHRYDYAPLLLGQAHALGLLERVAEQASVANELLEVCPDTESRCLGPRQHAFLMLAESTTIEDWETFDRLCASAFELADREAQHVDTATLSVRPYIHARRAIRLEQRGDLAQAEREVSVAIDESLSSHRALFPSLLQMRARFRIDQGKYEAAQADAVDLARFGGPEDESISQQLQAEIARKMGGEQAP